MKNKVKYRDNDNRASILKQIKSRRIGLLRHINRMEVETYAKSALDWKLEGRRGRGRPRKKCMNLVEEDLMKVGCQNWKQKTKNKKE